MCSLRPPLWPNNYSSSCEVKQMARIGGGNYCAVAHPWRSNSSTKCVHNTTRIRVTVARAHAHEVGFLRSCFSWRIVRRHVIHCRSKWALVNMAAYLRAHVRARVCVCVGVVLCEEGELY